MNVSELRIGNYVLLEDKGIYQIDSGHDIDEIDSFPIEEKYCQGVPLTEEWLLKFGFEIDDEYDEGGIHIENGFKKYPLCVRYGIRESLNVNILDYLATKIEYVHSLQNLYFALTGEELTINK